MQLNNLNIVDGNINLYFLNNAQLRLEHATTFVQAEQLVASRQLGSLQKSVHILNFRKGIFTSGGHRTELDDVVFTGGVNQLKAGRLSMNNHGRLLLNAKNVLIPALNYDEESQNLTLQELYWKEADIRLLPSGEKVSNPSGSFVLKNVHGGTTRLNRKDGTHELSISIDTLSAREFSANAAHRLYLDGFKSAGGMLHFNNGQFDLSARSFVLNDRAASMLKNVSFTRFSEQDSIDISIPSMELVPDFNAMFDGKLHLDEISVHRPVIIAQLQRVEKINNGTNDHKTPDLSIGRLKMLQPDVHLTQTSEKGSTILRWKGDPDNFIELTSIEMPGKTSNGMEIGGLSFTVDHFNFKSPKGKSFDTREGHITTVFKAIRLQPNEAGGWDWQGRLEQLTGKNLRFESLGKQSGTLTVRSAQLNNLSINSLSLLNLREVLLKNTAFSMKNISGSYHTSADLLDWHNATYDKHTRAFTVDSLSYRPALDREEFMKSKQYQADHLVARTGKIEVLPFHIDRFIRDTVIELGSVNIHDARLDDFRDQRLPREPGVVKALPANLLKRIPHKLWIDTLKLIDGFVEYSEFNEKTNQEGSIRVNRLNARVTHLRNFQFEPNDSLHIRASAYLEDSLYTSLDLRESYSDTLGGFLMTERLGPGDLTILNPVLVPLAGAKVHSGILDSMHMRVVGREYLAFGEMYMYYRDLKIRIIRNADEKKKGFLIWIVNGLVNTVVRDHNNGKPGTVFFKRLRDRSAINYLVKITISGVGSSIGFKKNKKQVRRYKREILNKNLPPIHID